MYSVINKKHSKIDKNTVKRKLTLMEELKMKIPELVPKNMIN